MAKSPLLIFEQSADFFAQYARRSRSRGPFHPVVEAWFKGIQPGFKGIYARCCAAGGSDNGLQVLFHKRLRIVMFGLLGRGRCQGCGNRLTDAIHETLVQGMALNKHVFQFLTGQAVGGQFL